MDSVVEAHLPALHEVGPESFDLVHGVRQLLRGGKRLRALFMCAGYGFGPGACPQAAVRASAAMEFFQAAALLHDDVMDHSDTRRGQPTLHRALEQHHRDRHWIGDPASFGVAGAILGGNLCLVWCDDAFARSGLPAAEQLRARPAFDTMRSQLMAGQFLDVLVAHRGWTNLNVTEQVQQSRRISIFKSALYSVEQPLLIGALAAGAAPEVRERLSVYGRAIGEAFQLRDDLLGVFGDPEVTGKPAGDDIAEGKRTSLIAWGLHLATPADAQALSEALGHPQVTPEQVQHAREVLTQCGAVDRVEALISQLHGDATAAIAPLLETFPEPWERLTALGQLSVERTS
ncbi:putative exported isomerase [Platysternon megacephalum]|uniref:Putative exported isomerase n=1 Tax=Platysternon megacephalum TaxID=55544 RepID=A0A4D9DIT7_9SAUR|nr:putative exported isomerase [Platysternon megacephalum]